MSINALDGMKFLILDDEETITQLISQFLMEHNAVCDIAYDGKQGFEKNMQSHYDFIITDIMMPNMNGVEFIKAIREIDPVIPILIVTGIPHEKIIQEAMDSGANGFLKKPFEYHELIELILKILKA